MNALSLVALALAIYSFFLLCWGVALSPARDATEAQDEPEEEEWEEIPDEGAADKQ